MLLLKPISSIRAQVFSSAAWVSMSEMYRGEGGDYEQGRLTG